MAFDCFVFVGILVDALGKLQHVAAMAINGPESFEVREPDCTAALAERLYQESPDADAMTC